jgi:hypothetical protein
MNLNLFEDFMKPMALILLALVLIVGTYLNQLEPEVSQKMMIEDSVGSTMAAPLSR